MAACNPTWAEVTIAKEENRRELVLRGEEISARVLRNGLDNNIYNLQSLNFLEISKTCLETLDEDLGKLSTLVNLILHSNNLTTLPKSLGKLTKLKVLDVSSNKLESVPEEIVSCEQLVTLNLGHNKLTYLPSLKNNKYLGIVDFSSNELQVFPDLCSRELNRLTEINVKDNKIPEVPADLSNLISLKTLNLSENVIETVPGELADCPKLKEIHLKSNKLLDKHLERLVDKCHGRQVIEYVKQKCSRNDNAATKPVGGKGKKKGKKAKDDEENLNVDEFCHEMHVLHVSESAPKVVITESTKSVRPYILCCIIRDIHMTENKFKRFIQMQTKLHDTVCEKRNVATIATHDLDRIAPGNLLYDARPPQLFSIQPLMRQRDFTAGQLFTLLQKEAEKVRKEKKRNTYSGIHKYLYLLEGKSLYPCLLDSADEVISFPPITNSDVTKITLDTKNVFAEVTSSVSLPICKTIMDALLLESLNMGLGKEGEVPYCDDSPKSLILEQVKIFDRDGNMRVLYPSRTDLFWENKQVNIIRE